MQIEEALRFVDRNHRAMLATLRADGQPQLSPVTVALDGDGRVVVSTRRTAMKTRNLLRHPRAWLCVINDGFFGEWAQLEGEAEVVELPEAMEGLEDYYRRASGEHPDWDDYRRAMRDEQRVLVRITVDRAGPTVSG
ncbi:MAG TPA: PPOX class F420-dependent oxidoreductase [Acidimicrobiales bacterium]|nr:PPOX class F420-dependent oxidoreductase [Acidimicrobiales bacterium]